MKLEVGIYVKTRLGIGEIVNISQYDITVYFNDNNAMVLPICETNIKKASHNIIDLIEVGDILHDKNDNEYWTVQRIEKDELGNTSIQIEWESFDNEEEFLNAIDEIITKEQAKNISYKLGE